MKHNYLLKLLRCVSRPIIIQINYNQQFVYPKVVNTRVNSNIWNPDSKGGDAWCIQSFCLHNSNWLADFRNSYYILYSSDLLIPDVFPICEGIKFKNLYREIAFAEGTAFDWGLYFAKYFSCSLIFQIKNPDEILTLKVRPEDTLNQVLKNCQFSSALHSVVLTRLTPELLYMSN